MDILFACIRFLVLGIAALIFWWYTIWMWAGSTDLFSRAYAVVLGILGIVCMVEAILPWLHRIGVL